MEDTAIYPTYEQVYEQENPAPKVIEGRPSALKDFVNYISQYPGQWFIYTRTGKRGQAGGYSQLTGNTVTWCQRSNHTPDRSVTIYARNNITYID